MGHMIDMSNDRANIVYVGETPWHRLGTPFTGDESFDDWREAAGFGWSAEMRKLRYPAKDVDTGVEIQLELPEHRVLVRDDTQSILGVVNRNYKTVQPKEVLEFFRDVAFASDGAYTMETAGCLFGGRRIWALARTKHEIRIGGTDVLKPFLLFGTGFDGKISTFASHTIVRVVCHNTLSASVGAHCQNADIRIPHMQVFDEAAVKRALGLIAESEEQTLAAFAETADVLADRKVDDAEMFTFFAELYGPKREDGQEVSDLKVSDFTTGQKRNIDQLIRLFKAGPGADLPTAAGTTWGLVNAVTHFEDHSRGKDAVARLQSAGFGAGKRRKAQAVDVALALAA